MPATAPGLRPLTTTLPVTGAPASRSDWVTAYGVALAQLIVAPGARVVPGQVAAPVSVSATATALIVTLPVLVTAYWWAIVSPGRAAP